MVNGIITIIINRFTPHFHLGLYQAHTNVMHEHFSTVSWPSQLKQAQMVKATSSNNHNKEIIRQERKVSQISICLIGKTHRYKSRKRMTDQLIYKNKEVLASLLRALLLSVDTASADQAPAEINCELESAAKSI